MKIALWDVDSRIPNLAIMKLSSYWKEKGATVEAYQPLWMGSYDKIYASTVFAFSDKSQLNEGQMIIGGTGWDVKKDLPPEVEAMQPDYTFYNYPHSLGFTMRGCRFACKFCVVPQKEGKPKPFNTIDEIWTNRGSDFVILLDNDFFGNPQWRERIEEMKKYDLKINFSQGLNIRIITDEQVRALSEVRFRNISNTSKMIHFAWDRFNDEKLIDKGIERVLNAGIKPYQMTFYILIGYDTTPGQDLYRVNKLKALGMNPFVMPYNKKEYYQRRFARWVNHKAIFKSV